MYTNTNLDAHLAALLFLGTAALLLLLAAATVATSFWRRAWLAYPLLAIVAVLTGYGLLLAAFSFTSYDRTAKRGDEKLYCGMDCHIGYSVQNAERTKAIGDTNAGGEFYVITLRSHFDERSIAPWRGNGPLTPDPPSLTLIDGSGHHFAISVIGQKAWNQTNPPAHSLTDPLRPGESYETTWVFDVPAHAQSLRLFAGWDGFPSYLLIGDEASPGHRKTYFAL